MKTITLINRRVILSGIYLHIFVIHSFQCLQVWHFYNYILLNLILPRYLLIYMHVTCANWKKCINTVIKKSRTQNRKLDRYLKIQSSYKMRYVVFHN